MAETVLTAWGAPHQRGVHRLELDALGLEQGAARLPSEGRVRAIVSCGTPLPGVVGRIVSGGTVLPEGKVGELWLQSPNTCEGYCRKPADTEAERHEMTVFQWI
jgi:acyl-CoA synthetase (AMP-forming)/AMP-acid ligase II